MTCIDDNANSHLSVSDGAASKQKTLTAEAGPGLVWMLPGDEKRQGVLWWPLHAVTGSVTELEVGDEHKPSLPSSPEEQYELGI